ncbi:MAG: hypothetical protein M3Q91_02275, partial [Acidobacteriota bacterium]|nr:hypothetical protein [Acidobacteriota bacterium]
EALANLLNGNKALELWRDVLSASQFAERFVIENSPAVPGKRQMCLGGSKETSSLYVGFGGVSELPSI